MTLAKAVVTGVVYKNPEKRYTSNNIPVTAFVLNIGEKEEMLIRVLSKRNVMDEVVANINKGDRILVEGKLQITNVKTENGTEKRIYEIDAATIEQFRSSDGTSVTSDNEEIVKFAEEEFSDELIGEDEIPF